jgi:hypothetical protein
MLLSCMAALGHAPPPAWSTAFFAATRPQLQRMAHALDCNRDLASAAAATSAAAAVTVTGWESGSNDSPQDPKATDRPSLQLNPEQQQLSPGLVCEKLVTGVVDLELSPPREWAEAFLGRWVGACWFRMGEVHT